MMKKTSKERQRKGWVVLDGRGGPTVIHRSEKTGEVVGRSGYGELYYLMKAAREDATELGNARVAKAKLVWWE